MQKCKNEYTKFIDGLNINAHLKKNKHDKKNKHIHLYANVCRYPCIRDLCR